VFFRDLGQKGKGWAKRPAPYNPVQQLNHSLSAVEAKLEMAEKVLSYCTYNLQLTMQIWIRVPENIESLLAKRAENSAEIASITRQLREQSESEEEKQLLDTACPRWNFSESYGELLRQIVDGQASAAAEAEMRSVLLPLLLDHASWKGFVEYLRALTYVGFTGESHEKMIGRTRALLRQNQDLKSVVAERKRLDERLSQLASIIEGANDAIVLCTLGGTIVNWNNSAERLYGYSSSEVLGRSRYMLIAPDQPDEIGRLSEKLLKKERIPAFEATHIRKDGTRIRVSLSLSPVQDMTSNTVGFAAITREIGDSKA
jgi:PAS domain S-box-containing protein